MPHWWSETLTLYRRLEAKDEDGRRKVSWKRETLKHCFAKITSPLTYGGGQVITVKTAVFRVPVSECFMFARGDILMIGDVAEKEPPMVENNTFVLDEVYDNSRLANAHFYGRSGAL